MIAMFKKTRLWIGGAGLGIGLLVLLIGLLWGLIARLLQLNRQQSQAAGQATLLAPDGHSGMMTVQPTPSAPSSSQSEIRIEPTQVITMV
jgi:predicted lipid-binding transport protein (Tim44 family)